MSRPAPDHHFVAIDQPWNAVKRDVFHSVEMFAGLHLGDDLARLRRLERNWRSLCDLDADVAAHLWHGFDEVAMMFGKRGPRERYDRLLRETFDLDT